ncbi:MAG TPA: hypothetical protein VLG92_05765 [Candidatus Saccharimonadia bacterium]|nr:hypothetical protein [Candidatus Saccharimonadia bacterium]
MLTLEGCLAADGPLYETDDGLYTVFPVSEELSPPALLEGVYARHGRRFVAHGIVKEDALLPNGSLPADLDKMRGPGTLAITREGLGMQGANDIWRTDIRLKEPANGEYQDLPSYARCKESFFDGVPEMVARLALTRTIFEAGAFAGDPKAPPEAMHAVFRKLIELILMSPESEVPGANMALFMGMAKQTHDKLSALYAPETLQPIGRPTSIDLEKHRVLQPLVPLVMYPDTFIGNLVDYWASARDAEQKIRRGGVFLYFTERLRSEHMPGGYWYFRNKLLEDGYEAKI